MITIQKQLELPDTYPLERIGSLDELLFFDIETTGFSGEHSTLYLIGCTWYTSGSWNLIQWFADTSESEVELLHAFFTFLKNFRILIHFNGDGFDIPYLLKRCRHYQLSYDFSQIKSVDIYKKLRPYRKLLGLESMKQKALEQFLQVSRTDRYSGGQLIEVYQDYLVTHERLLYDLLMLHNEDDLKGMPSILPILNYPDFLEHSFCLTSQTILEKTDDIGNTHKALELICESQYCIPVPIETQNAPVHFLAKDNRLILTIDLYEGTLKHFYPNYKDYYYLPLEDTAIHKSVGEYVDRSARTRATAKTCYTKQYGCFVPQFEPLFEPVMKKEWKDKLTYVPFNALSIQKPDCFQNYLTLLFKHMGLSI